MRTLSSFSALRIVVVATLCAVPVSALQASAIKCWINSEGIRECGNIVPPEYSQQRHSQLNKQGVTINSTKRAKSRAELDEEARLAAIRREQERVIQRENESDQLLLDTFASADDIILAREGKLSVLKSEISLRKSMIEKLEASLEKIIITAANMERRGETPTEQILRDIKAVRSQIAENKRYILNKHKEQEDVKRKYADDLDRFNKLRAGNS